MLSRNFRLFVFAAFVAVSGCQTTLPDNDAVLYYGFSRVDPDDETVTDNSWVVLSGRTIEQVGVGRPPLRSFSNNRDMSGLYAMPGMIDAHAHITAGPHKIEIIDGAPAITIESVDEITQYHARVALAFGITTVRNPGGDPVANARYNKNIAEKVWVGPDALHAGAVMQPPPFLGNAFGYPHGEAEWQAVAAREAALGMTYFKLYTDLSEEELALGIKAAHDHGLKAIAHLNNVSWTRAIELGIDGLEHALPTSPSLLEPDVRQSYIDSLGPDTKFMYRWFELVDYDGPLMRELISQLASKEIETNLTLFVNEGIYNTDDLEKIFPEESRRYFYPENLEAAMMILAAGAAAWTEEDYIRARAVTPKMLEFARRLHEAGVPIMIGTDGYGGGPSYAHELELHVEAGIPVWAVLRYATSAAAETMGLSNQVGMITDGMEADIVFLKANPVDDVTNVEQVHTVIANGTEYSFEELTAHTLVASGAGE